MVRINKSDPQPIRPGGEPKVDKAGTEIEVTKGRTPAEKKAPKAGREGFVDWKGTKSGKDLNSMLGSAVAKAATKAAVPQGGGVRAADLRRDPGALARLAPHPEAAALRESAAGMGRLLDDPGLDPARANRGRALLEAGAPAYGGTAPPEDRQYGAGFEPNGAAAELAALIDGAGLDPQLAAALKQLVQMLVGSTTDGTAAGPAGAAGPGAQAGRAKQARGTSPHRYEGSAPRLDAAQIDRLEPGEVIPRSAEEMRRMYKDHGDLLPAGRYYEKLFDHGTGKPSEPVGASGKALIRTSSYPRTDPAAHRPVTLDVVDVTKLEQLGLPAPKNREEVEQLKRNHPEVITAVRTETEADTVVKLPPGHRFMMMGPSGTMGMLANAENVTSTPEVRWD